MALPEFELVAVCTGHEATARESAEKFGVPMAFHNHEEMLQHADIDIVGISVRVPLHHRMVRDALEAGKHVYAEWPFCSDLCQAAQMSDLAKVKGLRTMVGLQTWCSPVFLRLKELVEEGYVGQVLSINMSCLRPGILARTSDRTWQSDRSLGATTLSNVFGAVIDPVCMCLGEFEEVSALVTTQVQQWEESDTGRMVDVSAPDNILVSGRLQEGAVISAHVGSIPWHGTGYRLEVYGRGGTIVVTAPGWPSTPHLRIVGGQGHDSDLCELTVPDRLTWIPDTVPLGPAFDVAQMWRRFADAIHRGKPSQPDFDTAVRIHRLLDTIQRASDTGQAQGLESGGSRDLCT